MKSSVKIPDSRIEHLAKKEQNDKGKYVLYLMQSAQRAEQNHALEWAVRRANELDKSLIVCFGLDDGFPEANKRHFAFMLQGLEKTASAIRDRDIGFVLRKGAPEKVALDLAQDSSHLVLDKGYLRYNRSLYKTLQSDSPVSVTQIETEPPVPQPEEYVKWVESL